MLAYYWSHGMWRHFTLHNIHPKSVHRLQRLKTCSEIKGKSHGIPHDIIQGYSLKIFEILFSLKSILVSKVDTNHTMLAYYCSLVNMET